MAKQIYAESINLLRKQIGSIADYIDFCSREKGYIGKCLILGCRSILRKNEKNRDARIFLEFCRNVNYLAEFSDYYRFLDFEINTFLKEDFSLEEETSELVKLCLAEFKRRDFDIELIGEKILNASSELQALKTPSEKENFLKTGAQILIDYLKK